MGYSWPRAKKMHLSVWAKMGTICCFIWVASSRYWSSIFGKCAMWLLAAVKYWWLILPAGLSVTFLAGGFYLVGRGLDEVFNPRLRDR